MIDVDIMAQALRETADERSAIHEPYTSRRLTPPMTPWLQLPEDLRNAWRRTARAFIARYESIMRESASDKDASRTKEKQMFGL